MKMGKWAWTLLAAPLLSGCAGFWNAPSSTSFTLANSGNITVSPGNSGTSTITVTPGSSFTGTVALTCAITPPSGATNPATCSLSTASLTFSSTSAQTTTLTAATTSSTTTGSYNITVTGTSSGVSATTTLCAAVSASSASCTATSGNSSSVFYVLNQGTKQIAAYSITSGVLNQISGSPYTLSSAPYSIAIAPNGSFLYVGTAGGIFLYTINSNGSLTLANSNAISQDVAASMQIDSTGSWLIDASLTLAGVQLNAIPITSSGAVNLSKAMVPVTFSGSTVYQLAISPDNTHIFVAEASNGTEYVSFAAGNISPFGTPYNIGVKNANGGAAVSVAVDPNSRLLYIGEVAVSSGTTNTGGLRAINYSTLVNSNTIVEAPGSPYATGGLAPYSIAPTDYGSNAGNYVYVANRTVSGSSTGSIAGFAVNSSSGTYTLTALNSTVSAGITPLGLTQDSTGNYMLVVNSGGSPDLGAYTFDTTTAGKLNLALSSATGTDPVVATAVAAAP